MTRNCNVNQPEILTFSFPRKQESEELKDGTPPAYLLRTQVKGDVEEKKLG